MMRNLVTEIAPSLKTFTWRLPLREHQDFVKFQKAHQDFYDKNAIPKSLKLYLFSKFLTR